MLASLIDAPLEDLIADLTGNPEPGGRILGVGDHEVDRVMLDERGQAATHELTPGTADDVADEEDAQCLFACRAADASFHLVCVRA